MTKNTSLAAGQGPSTSISEKKTVAQQKNYFNPLTTGMEIFVPPVFLTLLELELAIFFYKSTKNKI